MSLYKVEYWSQKEEEISPKMLRSYTINATDDRQAKSFVSKRDKFYPEYSTPWKLVENESDTETIIYKREIKKKILKEWAMNKPNDLWKIEIQRYILVKKPLTETSNKKFLEECNGLPRHIRGEYFIHEY